MAKKKSAGTAKVSVNTKKKKLASPRGGGLMTYRLHTELKKHKDATKNKDT